MLQSLSISIQIATYAPTYAVSGDKTFADSVLTKWVLAASSEQTMLDCCSLLQAKGHSINISIAEEQYVALIFARMLL